MPLKIFGKKILLLTGNILPATAGDSVFSFGLMTRLCEKNDVTLVTSVCAENFKEIKRLKVIEFQEPNGFLKHFNRFFRSFSISIIHPSRFKHGFEDSYDFVIVDHLRSYGIFKSLPKNIKKNKLIYLAHNVEYFNWLQKLKFEESKLNRLKNLINFGIKNNENHLIKISDQVHCLTKEDAYIIRNLYGKEEVYKTDVYFPFEPVKRDDIKYKSVLFLGSMEWFPNRHGVESFIENCVPHLDSQWTFHVVGSCTKLIRKKYKHIKNINFYGFKKDIELFFETMAVMVVPNKYGTGIKIKIYEALKKGIPVVAIYESAVGYELSEHPNLHRVNSWAELTQKLIELEKNSKI